MKVGYISELKIRGCEGDFTEWVERLVTVSKNESLDFLVVSGGISCNYHITLRFVDELGKQLKEIGTKLRFIVGNTDLYYPKDEISLDKKAKFLEIIGKYRSSQYYLPNHPILTRSVRIIGAESWYDYSLYRGKPINLRDITKKRFLFISNKDNLYITDKDDYTLGLENTFDYQYSNECCTSLNNELRAQMSKHGDCPYNVVVTYFKGSKALLSNSFMSKYFGAFEGSLKLGDIMRNNRVTHCMYGLNSDKKIVRMNGISYINTSGKVEVENYG